MDVYLPSVIPQVVSKTRPLLFININKKYPSQIDIISYYKTNAKYEFMTIFMHEILLQNESK